MITKIGSVLEYALTSAAGNSVMGAIDGVWSSWGLTDEQKRKLAEHYGLPESANFMARNVGRGIVGGLAGAAPGIITGAFLHSKGKIMPVDKALANALSTLGSLYSANYATKKYSTDKALQLLGKEE